MRRVAIAVLWTVLASLGVGCMVGTAAVNVLPPQLAIESGNDQTAEVGTTLAQPFVVTVRDANHNPVAGITVLFAVESGGGSLSTDSAVTDALGQAQSTLTVGTEPGANSVVAHTPTAGGSVTFTATATAPIAVMFATHVKPILDASCVSCHRAGGPAAFTPLDSFVAVRYGVSTSDGAPLVVDGTPASSVLAQKIQTTGSMYASLGPDTTTRDENAQIITAWIREGALNTARGAASKVSVVAGNNQSATVATALTQPLVARVTDDNDNPIEGETVTFAITSGGGTLSAQSATTNALGEARSTLTVGPSSGVNTVLAAVSGLSSSVTFTSTGTAGNATQIALVSGNNQTATVGTAVQNPLVVAMKDAAGNPVSGFMVTFAVAMGAGTLSADTVMTNAQGLAQTALTVGQTAGMNTVTVNATGLTGSPITFTATGTAGAAAAIAVVSGNNQSATSGAALPMPLVVAVTDTYGNGVAGTAVTFAVTSGGGSLSATSVTTNAMGRAQTALTLGSAAGTNTVTATRAGLTGSPITFTATGTTGTATQISLVSGNNQSGTVATALNPFVVLVRDANGNPVSGFSVSFTVASGGGSLQAASAVTNALGQASTTLVLGTTAGTNTVTANATGLVGSPVTFTATATAGTAAQIALASGNNQTARAGTALPMPFVVAVKDMYGNAVSGVAVSFAVTGGGGSLSATTATTNTMGLGSATLTLGTTAGTNTVTATRAGLTGSPVTFTATGTAGAASQIALVSGNNQTGNVKTALANPFVVVVRDASGNPVSGFSVSFAVTGGGGTLSATSATTNAMGQAQTTLTLGATAGANTVTANATGLTGSPITFTAMASAGAATSLAIASGNNQTTRVGGALPMPFVVVVKDSGGNPVAGFAVTFAVATGGGSLSATTATTNSSGQAQTTLTLGATPGTNTVTANASGLTGSPVTFTATGRRLTYEDDVKPILVAGCVSCHMAGGQASFTPLTTYTQVRFGTSFFSTSPLVVPNNPTGSLLVQKTAAGASMYANLGADTATRDRNAKTISDWVAQGALNTAVGAASQIVMTSGNNQSAPVNTTLTNPLVVTVMDASLNPVSGVTVTFAVTAGGGTLSLPSMATSAQGTASTTLKLGATAGTNTVTASATGLTNSPITFTATATAGSYSGAPLAGSTNPFDVAALIALKAANVEPVALSTDGEFLRRVTADLAGRLPTLDEWMTFAASTDPLKREQAIDRLLASPDFGTHWGIDIMAAWLTVEKDSDLATAVASFETYLVDAANTDKPLSTVASELAQGTGTGGIAFDAFNMVDGERYKAADRLLETFTGIPTKCARCHDSKITGPLDDPKWTMAQNRGLYKFFEVDAGEFNYYDTTLMKTVNPTMMFVVDGVSTNPTSLPAPTDTLAVRRARFAQLLVASNAFKRGTAHRIFAEVMQPLLDSNKFLAQQIADVKVPEVLKASTSVFSNQNTSLKGYLRTLMRSKLYQLTTKGTTTANDAILGRHVLRRHNAETLQAGIVGVTGIADSTSARNDFLSKFGYPMERETITERSRAINTIQPLTILNHTASVPGKVTQTASTIAALATKVDGGTMTLDAAITEIFRRALTRDPTAAELTSLKTELATAATTKEKLEDVAAVVMASIEFATR